MFYWHIHTGGLDQLIDPLIEYYVSMIPKMKENAEKLFGCCGNFLSTYTTLYNGYVSPVVPVIANWISGAGWICQYFLNIISTLATKNCFEKKSSHL